MLHGAIELNLDFILTEGRIVDKKKTDGDQAVASRIGWDRTSVYRWRTGRVLIESKTKNALVAAYPDLPDWFKGLKTKD